MKTQIERMCRAMNWANQEVLASLRDDPAARDAALPLMSHIVVVERLWMSRLREREANQPIWPHLSLSECDALAAENAAEYAGYLAERSESDLAATVQFRNSKGQDYKISVIDILIHVVTHGVYHRGQIANAVARSGAQSVTTDYIKFASVVEPTGV